MNRTLAATALLVFTASALAATQVSASALAPEGISAPPASVATGGGGGGTPPPGGKGAPPAAGKPRAAKITVSATQYKILYNQCRYADTRRARRQCRHDVRVTYRIGAFNENLDCRTYSGITVCGTLKLNKRERRCVVYLVKAGLSSRRAEVECYAFV
ncbi:hypothetical protein [Sphaerisporangium sp. NPDC051011]|uniref:hypothetical protein n=1 Tax=Sphaerisporangium sp. NPDC051011 TaxID=3155792 RepID=UPI0033DDD1CD